MNLRQQIIQDRITKTANLLNISEDLAFVRYAHSLITDRSIHAFAQNDLIEGGQEKQIDTFTIDQNDEEATIYLIQVKNTDSFSSNTLIKMRNGLDWVFKKSRSDIDQLSNTRFKDKISEYRAIQNGIGPANIDVIVAFVTNGLSSDVSPEFQQEKKTIMDQYDNGTFAKFDFQIWGADELVNYSNKLERTNRKIDADLRILYDTNNPSLIKYHTGELKGIICTVSAKEIAEVIKKDKDDAIFDSNIRRFLGSRGAVNSDIKKTCTDPSVSFQFWFLNNGITIVCDSFDAVTDPDDPRVKIRNMQIVNGCQTSKTLAMAASEGGLTKDTRVLLRIYETTNINLVDKIVLTTNNQNKITSRDLHANKPEQIDMQNGFAKYGYFYERKSRQYDDKPGLDINHIMVNEIVAQSYLSIVLKMPSDASRRKYKVWSELYDKIFNGKQGVEPYILATKIYLLISKMLEDEKYSNSTDDIQRKLANNGSFHIARIVAHLWRKSDEWGNEVTEDMKEKIDNLEKMPQCLNKHLEKALNILSRIIRKKYADIDVVNTLKLASLDSDINKHLYTRKVKK
jgi:hypothetical protein